MSDMIGHLFFYLFFVLNTHLFLLFQGYIAAPTLAALPSTPSRPQQGGRTGGRGDAPRLVLVRDVHSAQYRFAVIEV